MRREEILADKYKLKNLTKINILLGKNGCGKSTLLKEIDRLIRSDSKFGSVKYITPERGGVLIYNPSIDNNISSNPQWLPDARRKNRHESFREQSVAQFKTLEMLFLRELESTPKLRMNLDHQFTTYFNRINSLLDNIEVRRHGSTFKIYKKGTDSEIGADAISSGESELISLGIECLVFDQERVSSKCNVLLLDEPDVHLHPDLQARLSNFLKDLVDNDDAIIIVATHSTAFLGALEDFPFSCIEFMSFNQKELEFKKISDEYRKILPVFGASPLSNIFNKTPIFLVEGDDDERIWQQAVRRSSGKLKIYPCSTDGKDHISDYERDVEAIISSVYDNAKAFSLRDRDEGNPEIVHLKIIQRYKLQCRASENLLLTDEVLEELGCGWDLLKSKIDNWLQMNSSHSHYSVMTSFKSAGYNRKDFDFKKIRNDLMHIIGSPLTWEMVVGKVIGNSVSKNTFQYHADSLGDYLGKNLIEALVGK